jgi:hypothetical protein
MTAAEQKIAHAAIRIRSRQPIKLSEIEGAALLARRSGLRTTGALLEEEIARRRSGVAGGTDQMGLTLKLSPEADKRFREELAKVRLTVAEATQRLGGDANKAAGKVAAGLGVIGFAILAGSALKRRRA